LFRFALISSDGEALGPVAFARGDWKPGDIIPQGPGRNLRVVNAIEPDRAHETCVSPTADEWTASDETRVVFGGQTYYCHK
jgi:hypothetical protein